MPWLQWFRVYQAVPRSCRNGLYIERDELLSVFDGILLGGKVKGDEMMRCLDKEVGKDVVERFVAAGVDETHVKRQAPRTVDIGADGNDMAHIRPKPSRDVALMVRRACVREVWISKVAQGDIKSCNRRSIKMKGLNNDRHFVAMLESLLKEVGKDERSIFSERDISNYN